MVLHTLTIQGLLVICFHLCKHFRDNIVQNENRKVAVVVVGGGAAAAAAVVSCLFTNLISH